MKYIILVLLILNTAYAYIPTVESLFRNGGNESVDGNTVSADFIMTRKNAIQQTENETLQELPSVYAYKVQFNNAKERAQLIQISYSGNIISKSNMLDVQYFPQVTFNSLKLNSEDYEKKLFYALLNSLVNNEGSLMIDFLNSVGLSALKNTEKVNRDQIALIGRYINYLKQIKENPDAELENPLEPTTPEAKEKVKEILKSPFLTKSQFVSRVKEQDKVYFLIKNDNVEIKFDGQDHELISMKVNTNMGMMEVRCFNYVVFTTINKTLKFPQLVLLRDLQGNEFELKMQKLRTWNEGIDKFLKRLNGYRDDLKQGLSQENLGKSPFIL